MSEPLGKLWNRGSSKKIFFLTIFLHDPAIPLLGTYPQEMKTGYQKDICNPMFTEASFTIAKIWKQSKCLSMDGFIYIYIYIYKMNIIQP